MNFGMPYMGSKNFIAQKIVDFLPRAEHFYDLFGGGGAISHCALLSGKYKYVHYNELNPLVYKGFQMAINGEFKDENRWISREDFNVLKDSDPYVAICFSFGNNLKAYMYDKKIEPIKKAFHYAICFDDYSLLDEYLGEYKVRLKEHEIFNRRLELQRYLTKLYRKGLKEIKDDLKLHDVRLDEVCNSIEKLEKLDRLQELYNGSDIEKDYICSNLNRLEREIHESCQDSHNIICTNKSYEQIQIENNSVIYCDIPYKNTAKYQDNFDYGKFYDWCLQQNNIYISEYQMPEDFKCILEIEKRVKFSSNISNLRIEKLFTPKNNPYYRELKHFESEDW